MARVAEDVAWLSVGRFMEVAAKGDESVRPFAELGVHLWKSHHRQHLFAHLPELTAVRTGNRCDITFSKICACDTETVSRMLNDIPQFASRCTDIVSDADSIRTTYTLALEPDELALGNTRPVQIPVDTHLSFLLQADIAGISPYRLSRVARVIAYTKAQMDSLEIQTEATTDISPSVDLYIGPVAQFSTITMLKLSKDPDLGITRVSYTRMDNGLGFVCCTMSKEAEPESASVWSTMKNWFSKDKRKDNRTTRQLKPY